MTCKDCVHYDLCRSCSRIQLGWRGNSVHYVENIEEICKDFKDRSRFVELPCRVDDILELFEEFFELGADASDRLYQENSWADYPDEEIDKQNYRYHELGQIFLENLQEGKLKI